MTRKLPGSILLLPLLAALYVMLADFSNLRQAQNFTQPTAPAALTWPQPWGGYAWAELAGTAVTRARLDPTTAAEILQARVRNYPIDPQPWLALARLQSRVGDHAATEAMLRNAYASRPADRDALWTSAQIALQSSNAGLAERQLRLWLQEFPDDTGRALFIGSRWTQSPDELLDRILPQGGDYLREAMRVALRQQNLPLADAIWARLAPGTGIEDPALQQFVELLIRVDQIERAAELWAGNDPSYFGRWPTNGDFDREPVAAMGFEWQLSAPASVRITRDTGTASSPPASLRIVFNGKENVALNAPRVRMPLTPGQHYRLSGRWRGQDLTTRSLPFWHMSAAGWRETVPVPGARFDWQDWSIEFRAGEDARMLQLDLRRNSTQAFDRNIGGTLWLDDIRLEPIETPPPLPTIPELLREAAHG